MSCIALPNSPSNPTIITYNPSEPSSSPTSNETAINNKPTDPQQPHTHPIAHFNSKPHPNPTSSLSDVNSSYMLYSVKNGLVRVMEHSIHATNTSTSNAANKKSTATMLRTLLRGHSKRISDVSFFRSNNPTNQTDVVGTVSGREYGEGEGEGEGGEEDKANVLIWRIYKREHELVSEKLLEIRLKDAIRIVWHPFNPNQFVLLHNNGSGRKVDRNENNHDDDYDDDDDDDKLEYHIVATFVETTRLMTIKHETENHAVCTCVKRDEIDYKPSYTATSTTTESREEQTNIHHNYGGSFNTNGTLKLVCFGPLNQVGIHDLCWSNQDTRHVLTAHKDGNVKLWDLRDVVYLDTRTGEEVDDAELQKLKLDQQNGRGKQQQQQHHGGSISSGSTSSSPFVPNSEYIVESAKCIMTFNVNSTNSNSSIDERSTQNQEVQRCMFLPSFQDASLGEGKNEANTSTITSPFLTVTKCGTCVSLWSPFTSTGSPPSIIRTFQLGGCDPNAEYSVSLCTIPKSMMKSSSGSDLLLPSSYVLFANKTDGNIYALHLKNTTSSSSAVEHSISIVKGFDYIVPFRATQPIYSWTAMVSNDDNDQESEEGWKIDLFCVQSKSVQLLTLTSKMLSPSKSVSLDDGNSEFPHGVTIENLSVGKLGNSMNDDNGDDNDFDFDEEEYDVENDADIEYDEYDEEEEETEDNDDGLEDTKEGKATADEKPLFDNVPPPPMPGFLGGNNDKSNHSFANWLGNLAGVSVQSNTTKKEEVYTASTAPPTPPATPATPATQPKMNIDLSNIPLPTVPDVELQATFEEKAQVDDADETKNKSILDKPRATQRYLSPIEMLASVGKEKSGSEEIKLISTKKFDSEKDGGKAASKSEKKEPKKKLQQKTKTIQPMPFPSKDGKIAILKREDTSAKPPAAAPSAHTTGPSSTIGISKMEVEDIVRKALSSHFQKQENVIAAEIQKAVRYEVQSGLVPTLNKTVSQTLDQTVSKTMKSTVTKTVKESTKINASELADDIAQKLQEPLTESFYKSIRDLMIPAFESGTRQMFEQISTSIEKGLDLKQQSDNDIKKEMELMSKRMDAMAKTMEVLIQGVAKMTVRANASTATSQISSLPPVDKIELLKGKIKELLAAQDYGKAFTTALTASNADIAVFACKFSDLSIVLESETPKLSQPIMLCLMQQLGADFSPQKDEDLPVKLAWLQSLALTIDPSDDSIRNHLVDVCQNLITNLQAKVAEPNVILRREMQMLIQVVKLVRVRGHET